MNVRLLAAAAALSIVTGCSVAYCQHQGDRPPPNCAGMAYEGGGRPTPPSLRKTAAPVRPAPMVTVTHRSYVRPTPTVTVTKTTPHHHHGQSHEIDIDLDGC